MEKIKRPDGYSKAANTILTQIRVPTKSEWKGRTVCIFIYS